MRRAMFGPLPVLLLTLAAAGCDSIVGLDPQREDVGTIEFHNEPIRVDVPDTVRAGESFQVAVLTYGGGCTRKRRTDVSVVGLIARVTPIDSEVRGDHACAQYLATFAHEATLTFSRAGRARITFNGRRQPGASEISITREVVVLGSTDS